MMQEEIPFECCTYCRKDMSKGKSVFLYATLAVDLKEDIFSRPIARLCEPCAMKLNNWLFEGDANA